MIDKKEAEEMGRDLARAAHAKVKLGSECKACGCTPATAGEMEVLRKILKEHGVEIMRPIRAEDTERRGPRPVSPFGRDGQRKTVG